MRKIIQEELMELPSTALMHVKIKKIENMLSQKNIIPCYSSSNRACREKLREILNQCLSENG